MYKYKILAFSILSAILLTIACKKDENSESESQNSSFLENNANMKVLFSYQFPFEEGLAGIASTKISVQDDGNYSWCFGKKQNGAIKLYRFKIDGSTGAELPPDGDLSKISNFNLYTADEQNGKITFVEGTGKLYQSTLGSAVGDIPTYSVSDVSFNGLPVIAQDGDAYISSNPHPISTTILDRIAQMWSYYKHNGISNLYITQHHTGNNSDTWWHGGTVFPSGGGTLSGFAYTRTKAFLIDLSNSQQNSTIYYDSIPFTAPLLTSEAFTANYFTRTSLDKAKTIIVAKEYANTGMEIYFSTFIINNLTHKITKVVDKAVLPDFNPYGNSWDVDLDGNIYYITSNIASGREKQGISKATATNIISIRSNFLNNGNLKEIAVGKSGKIAVAIQSSVVENGKTMNSFNLCVLK